MLSIHELNQNMHVPIQVRQQDSWGNSGRWRLCALQRKSRASHLKALLPGNSCLAHDDCNEHLPACLCAFHMTSLEMLL